MGRRASTILTDSSLTKPIGEGTETREEGRQNKPDSCRVIVDALNREFDELLRVRQAIHPARAEIDAKKAEIDQLKDLHPGDKMPGEETYSKKKTEPLPLPIPSLPPKRKRPLPPTIILDIFLEMERDLKERDEFNRRRGILAEKLKAELKELEKQLENSIHQERNLRANVALLSERNRMCRAENG